MHGEDTAADARSSTAIAGPCEPVAVAADGAGNLLSFPAGNAAHGTRTVFVAAPGSDSVLRVETAFFADGFESGDSSAWSATLP